MSNKQRKDHTLSETSDDDENGSPVQPSKQRSKNDEPKPCGSYSDVMNALLLQNQTLINLIKHG